MSMNILKSMIIDVFIHSASNNNKLSYSFLLVSMMDGIGVSLPNTAPYSEMIEFLLCTQHIAKIFNYIIQQY